MAERIIHHQAAKKIKIIFDRITGLSGFPALVLTATDVSRCGTLFFLAWQEKFGVLVVDELIRLWNPVH